ncbi:MAG: hypothetical protein M5U31_04735 [Acidimicrobiia bacterium]|nr:hypothetical protein [Acidimicrobiia bacterium]
MLWTGVRVALAVGAALCIYLLAAWFVRMFHSFVPPEEPDPDDIRPVDYRYRCIVCFAEVTMTAASGDEEPEPPRHCREDMALVVEEGRW